MEQIVLASQSTTIVHNRNTVNTVGTNQALLTICQQPASLGELLCVFVCLIDSCWQMSGGVVYSQVLKSNSHRCLSVHIVCVCVRACTCVCMLL